MMAFLKPSSTNALALFCANSRVNCAASYVDKHPHTTWCRSLVRQLHAVHHGDAVAIEQKLRASAKVRRDCHEKVDDALISHQTSSTPRAARNVVRRRCETPYPTTPYPGEESA